MYEEVEYPKTLTVYGCNEAVANQLVHMLNRGGWNHDDVTEFICVNRIRCKELDSLAEFYYLKFQATVDSLLKNPPDWVKDSEEPELSQSDAEELALEDEYFRFIQYDARNLIKVKTTPLNFNWGVVKKYGWDVLYLMVGSHFVPQKVQKIDANNPYRPAAERACSLNLGVQGGAIPIQVLVDRLTIEKIKGLLAGIEFKKSLKKPQLVELFIVLPDAVDRFNSKYPMTDFFLFDETPNEIIAGGIHNAIAYRDYCKQITSFLQRLNFAHPQLPKYVWLNEPNSIAPALT